jgi:hypothetical protein
VPWFTVEDEEAVIRSLDRIADATGPIVLSVGKQEMFGENQDVPVNVINNQAPVKALHDSLLETLAEADSALDESGFVGLRYIAHISRHPIDGRHSNEGEEILVNEFHLVRLVDDNTCRVEQEFHLKHG